MVWRIGILISNKMVALSVQIFVGIILYGLFLLLMKDEFVMESIRRVKLKYDKQCKLLCDVIK